MFEQVYPFLWVKNNDINLIKQEIIAIKQSGMNAFCVESRIHPNFCDSQWWDIMDKILVFAKEQKMKVWLLDDKSYPTGSACGRIADDSSLRPYRIKAENVDLEGRSGIIRLLLKTQKDLEQDAEVLYVFRVRLEYGQVVSVTDLTSNILGNVVQFEYDGVPSRLVIVMKTRGGWECAERKNYIDMLNPDSVELLIQSVYEPHYERYIKNGKYVGVFEGFFSDEPRFANGFTHSEFSWGVHECARTVGMLGMAYPWSDKLWGLVEQNLEGINSLEARHILALWYDLGDETSAIRCAYMNAITKEYATGFCKRLSQWCHERGLVYGGHIIEDGGAHRRLACSPGHYFRSQEGTDYAAVDVVLHQIKPYYENEHIAPISGGYASPVFYNYVLAKLATSEALLDPKKQGRALCEIFGAYGWGESLEEMLFLTNHMLVRGINMFIPHAFSSEFPNIDCPPHFYSGGNNPVFEGFCVLGKYMADMCRRFSGGQAYTPVAILYDAEGEWSGRPFSDMDEIAKKLMENQINFFFIPEYKLEEYQDYECLIVPYREYLSPYAKQVIDKVRQKKKVYVITSNTKEEIERVSCEVKKLGLQTLNLQGDSASIRALRYDKDGVTEYLLHNENSRTCECCIKACDLDVLVEDVLNESLVLHSSIDGYVRMEMQPGQAIIVKFVSDLNDTTNKPCKKTSIDFSLIAENKYEKQYVAKVEGLQKRELEIHYEGEFLKVQIGDSEIIRITHPARITLPEDKQMEAKFIIKSNLAETIKDDLSRFSILRPVELVKVDLLDEQCIEVG